jgi:hypothetical protein
MIVQGVNNTYKTVRVMGEGYNLMYTVWCTNEHELYDMNVRPAVHMSKRSVKLQC